MKTFPPRCADNIIKFRLGGWPVDALDQEKLRQLRMMADRAGRSVEDQIREGMAEWLATRQAEIELDTKIVRFRRA